MVTIKIYIEGGGEGKDLDIRFREAWTKFFQAAGLKGKMPRPVRGKGRDKTFDLFCTAIQNPRSDEMPLLLVDSEDPVKEDSTVWQYLKARDDWDKPNNAAEKHAYLMVQVMETWLLADVENLHKYFGPKFKMNKIPAWTDLEAQTKQSVFDVLKKATQDCSTSYTKGKVSFEVLANTNPAKVLDKCPRAKQFLDFLAEAH